MKKTMSSEILPFCIMCSNDKVWCLENENNQFPTEQKPRCYSRLSSLSRTYKFTRSSVEHFVMSLLFLILISIWHVNSLHVTHISDCGTARGCWKLPNGCKDASDCETMLTWKHERRHLILEIESKLVKADMWLGIGFSKDELMGNDTVFECQFPATGSGSVLLSHNTAKRNIVLKTVSVKEKIHKD